MSDRHTPTTAFVDQLEREIGLELRRRQRLRESRGWMPSGRLKWAVSVAGVAIVSMAIGAAGVAAAYQAQTNQRRDALAASYEQRLQLAQQRLDLQSQQVQLTERQSTLALGSQDAVLEARTALAAVQAEVRVLASELQEVRLTGRDPIDDVWAPLVSGRDFVGERLQIALAVPGANIDLVQAQLHGAEQRAAVGIAPPADIEVARVRLARLEANLQLLKRKIDLRQKFLSGQADATITQLRVLESEAEQRSATLSAQIESARNQVARLDKMSQAGLAQNIDVAEARVRLQELQLDLERARLDLLTVRRKIEEHK